MRLVLALAASLAAAVPLVPSAPAHAFQYSAFVESMWADAKAKGVSRATFERATKGLTVNAKLKRLTVKQPEFASPVGKYYSKRMSKARVQGGVRKVRANRKLLARIEKRTGVDPYIVAAIWGLETSYGGYIGKLDVFRSLSTLAFYGYRDDFFRKEFVDALVMLQKEKLSRKRMRGSWAGAVGQTQFIPSSFLKHAVDFDRDGDRDVWRSEADALGSTANYLKNYGWKADLPWGFAIRAPKTVDAMTRSFTDWRKRGVKRLDGKALPKRGEATLFYPAGSEGQAFLVTSNFEAIKAYNYSDAYALVVAHLADRLRGGNRVRLDWPGTVPLTKSRRIALKKLLAKRGFGLDTRDGRITPDVRAAIRDVQAELGLVRDGHPDAGLLKRLGG